MASGGGIITVEYTTGGTATCVQDTEYGQYYILTATPSSGYTFSYWKVMTTNASGSIRYDNGDVSGGGFSYNDQFTYNPMWVQDGMGVDTVFKAFFESVTTTPDNLQTKTTKLITYGKSQLSVKGVTSTATTLRGVIDNISDIIVGGASAQLHEPTISLSGSTLTLTNPTTNGNFATGFNIYNGDTQIATQLINVTTLDLSTLLTEEGTYTITAKCYGTNMTESNASDSVSYNVSGALVLNLINGATLYQDDLLPSILHTYQVASGITVTSMTFNQSGLTTNYGVYYYDESSKTGDVISVVSNSNNLSFECSQVECYSQTTGTLTIYLTLSNGEQITDTAVINCTYTCLTGDMLITMANGSQKRVDQLSIGEYVLGFDKTTMELVPCKITYSDAQMNKSYKKYNIWTLSDGTILKTVHNHRFYCLENEAMTYVLPNKVMKEWQIGQHFVKADGTTPTLVKHETIKEKVNHYTIFCENNNYFVNGILSGNRYTKLSGVPFKQ